MQLRSQPGQLPRFCLKTKQTKTVIFKKNLNFISLFEVGRLVFMSAPLSCRFNLQCAPSTLVTANVFQDRAFSAGANVIELDMTFPSPSLSHIQRSESLNKHYFLTSSSIKSLTRASRTSPTVLLSRHCVRLRDVCGS